MQASHIRQPLLATGTIIDMNKLNMQSQAFKKIAPFWPLKNLIAVNPLKGFQNLPFEKAIKEGMRYFQYEDIPLELQKINRETIKWCQAFFDEGQATIKMPLREKGLYQCFKHLALYDKNLHQLDDKKLHFLRILPAEPEKAILICLDKLGIKIEQHTEFFSLLLTTLPGWASYVCYKTEWSRENGQQHSTLQTDYLALRIIITYLIWPQARNFLYWYNNNKSISNKNYANILEEIVQNEQRYQDSLLKLLEKEIPLTIKTTEPPKAQMVFCIDVRSEPFRRALEAQGNYETFGFAGFFGIPVEIQNELCDSNEPFCPVLLSPRHIVRENINAEEWFKDKILTKKQRIRTIKHLYQMLKYTFTTPFTLVEILGLWNGLWMLIRTVAPITAKRFKEKHLEFSYKNFPATPALKNNGDKNGISFIDQCKYAENFLRMIGLTRQFSSLIILCGHGADTENNAYHSALDCGACGGRSGAPNARILAAILNDEKIRIYLAQKNIHIPKRSIFIPALHNTTTDEIKLYNHENISNLKAIEQLQLDLLSARQKNNHLRTQKLSLKNTKNGVNHIKRRSSDWAQTRPEWGLAKNAAFIVGPRNLTKNIDVDGRAFLHSYNWEEDKDGALLAVILTAPMIVAQWINCQYLFSTIDNIAYGSGSKITHNITGKIGIIQGNASDLMHGLPLQSVNKNDYKKYHEPLRLLTVVYAPRARVTSIISEYDLLKNLFEKSWVLLTCIDPIDHVVYSLTPNLSWQPYS